MSEEKNEQGYSSGIEWGDLVFFVKCLFVCLIWFAFIFMFWVLIVSTIGTPFREKNPAVDAIDFNTAIVILATFIIVFQFSRLNNSLKEIKKAIEEKQPVIIQKRVSDK